MPHPLVSEQDGGDLKSECELEAESPARQCLCPTLGLCLSCRCQTPSISWTRTQIRGLINLSDSCPTFESQYLAHNPELRSEQQSS